MKTIQMPVFSLDELNDKAKERARDWYRALPANDTWPADFIIEDAKQIGDMLGMNITTIGYSGFSSQGDDAHFVGTWAQKPGAEQAVREYAPLDTELHRVAHVLEAFPEGTTATVVHRGRYQHDGCPDIDVSGDGCQADVIAALRQYLRWIYRQLEGAYEYGNSPAAVDKNIIANEHLFTIDGRIIYI